MVGDGDEVCEEVAEGEENLEKEEGGIGCEHSVNMAGMVELVENVSAISESSVLAFGTRAAVGTTLNFGLEIWAEHHGMLLK